MYLLGYDIGSSFVKASLVDAQSGECVASAFYPKVEMEIKSVQAGWAEQDPENWWKNLQLATAEVMSTSGVFGADVAAIGISYQMHGLVLVDKDLNVLRPSILGCDLRSVAFGEKAFQDLGEEWCLTHLLNSPGNFTASRLAWVKKNEPELFARIYKIMFPGDYIAMKLTGVCSTTVSGLSEGMLWDFRKGRVADTLLKYFGFNDYFIPTIYPTFSIQGVVTTTVANQLALHAGTPVSYRAGNQPNNALSLNVLNPGEIASMAGSSGFVYGVNGRPISDSKQRVNSFAHVNHTAGIPNRKAGAPDLVRIGVLLSLFGSGHLNSWLKHQLVPGLSYDDMNQLAARSPIGSKGLTIMPSRSVTTSLQENEIPGSSIHGIQFNVHGQADILRAAQESIVFNLALGLEAMNEIGIKTKVIRAGMSGLYLSPVFRETLAGVTGATIELFETDGAVGAAKGAGIGAGLYANAEEAFVTLKNAAIVEPKQRDKDVYMEAFLRWKNRL